MVLLRQVILAALFIHPKMSVTQQINSQSCKSPNQIFLVRQLFSKQCLRDPGFLYLLLVIRHPRSEVQVGNIFMIYYCITNDPWIWKLKAATLTTSEYLQVRNPLLSGPSSSGPLRKRSQGFSQGRFCLKAQLGQDPLQAHHVVLTGHDPLQVLRRWDLDFC